MIEAGHLPGLFCSAMACLLFLPLIALRNDMYSWVKTIAVALEHPVLMIAQGDPVGVGHCNHDLGWVRRIYSSKPGVFGLL